jgi:TolA-binding protein
VTQVRRVLRIVLPALALSATGCWTSLERGEMMEARIDKLESASDAQLRRLDEQQRRIEEQERLLKDRVAAIDKKIAEAQQKIDELNQAARRSGADLGVSVSKLSDDVARSRGDLEVEQHKLAQLEQEIADLSQGIDKRFAALKGKGALDEAEAKQLIDGLPRQDDKAAFLALAQAQEQKGNPGVAKQLYDEYLRRFPNDPAAPQVALKSGALAADQGRWKDSFAAYGWVYKNAPRSDAAPDAMLGMATAMSELDEFRADAPAVLKEIVDKYPKSAAAAKARATLAELAPKKPPVKKPPAKGGGAK